jgi:membrane protease YdiL (CAAX protease family)
MTAAARTFSASARGTALAQVAVMVAALAGITLVRAAINGTTVASAFVAGALFGLTLLAAAAPFSTPVHLARLSARSIAIGLAGGAAIVAIPLVAHAIPAPGFQPQPFVIWAAVTCLVAAGEEAMLRGAILDRARAVAGLIPAVLFTSALFALMHVPLYGWGVVPVDLGAGLVLCGLRLLSGGIAAPAIAHAIADLATWWL